MVKSFMIMIHKVHTIELEHTSSEGDHRCFCNKSIWRGDQYTIRTENPPKQPSSKTGIPACTEVHSSEHCCNLPVPGQSIGDQGRGAYNSALGMLQVYCGSRARLSIEVIRRRERALLVRAGNNSCFWEFCLQGQAMGSWEGPDPASWPRSELSPTGSKLEQEIPDILWGRALSCHYKTRL